MCDGPNGKHTNYTSLADHVIVDVTTDSSPALSDVDTPKYVKLLNLNTNEIKEITVFIIVILIGSKPDLHFLQGNFNISLLGQKCLKCKKKQSEYEQQNGFLKNRWHYLKGVIGQSIQNCKSRYLNYTEINGNTNDKCEIEDCKTNLRINGKVDDNLNDKCDCECNPYSDGIGYGVDEKKPVDCRSNPLAIDKSTHEMLNGPKGMYALGPVTADNFIRFLPGGALAIVSHLHKIRKNHE